VTGGPLRGAVLLYGLLAAGAFTWSVTDRGTFDLYHHPDPFHRLPLVLGILVGGAAGAAFGLAIARATRWAVRRFRWAGALHLEFQALLGPLPDVDILALALLSAVVEECFFRGAMQPTLGLIATSLIFGLMHFPVTRRFVPWTLQATTLGFALGGMFWLTGELAAPLAAHFAINYQNLHYVRRYHPPT
jgi:membrane protease YdiL (CAAX protease family)